MRKGARYGFEMGAWRGGFRRHLPQQVDGLEELLQNITLRLRLPRGCFLYDPGLGSSLKELEAGEENSTQRAWAVASEALLGMPGVQVSGAEYDQEAGLWNFTVETPLGVGQVSAPGKEQEDGQL